MVSSSAGQGMASPPASGHLIRKHPSAIGFSIKLNKGMMKKILSAEDKIRILVGSEGTGMLTVGEEKYLFTNLIQDPKLYQIYERTGENSYNIRASCHRKLTLQNATMPDDVKREDLTATRSKEYPAVITALDHLAPEEQQPPLPSPTIPLPSSPSSTSQSREEGNGNKKRSPKPHPWMKRMRKLKRKQPPEPSSSSATSPVRTGKSKPREGGGKKSSASSSSSSQRRRRISSEEEEVSVSLLYQEYLELQEDLSLYSSLFAAAAAQRHSKPSEEGTAVDSGVASQIATWKLRLKEKEPLVQSKLRRYSELHNIMLKYKRVPRRTNTDLQ